MRNDTVPLDYFERLYASRPDPWHLARSDYERLKYAATLQALPRPRYGAALEIGCATGVFTALLAVRCDDLLALEPVPAALDEAQRRNADRSWVRFAPMFVPAEWPSGAFDLVVISEVIDYLGTEDVVSLAERASSSLVSGGDLILVHWVGKKKGNGPLGEEATDRLIEALQGRLAVTRAERNTDYRLDVLRKV